MFKKGRKREARGLAVVYFFIGLIILFIILAVIYFALVELDYSDRYRNPDATVRAYVAMTPDPDAGLTDVTDSGLVDLTQETPEPTPIPTPTPTPTPEPTATPEPTPSPTPIPQTMVSQSKTDFTLPTTLATNVEAGITQSYVSQADNNRFMYLAGYAYVNDAKFDGQYAKYYLIVSESTTGKKVAYEMTMKAGASGVSHDDAQCKNASACDFECVVDVAQNYQEGIYNLGIVMGYKAQNQRKAAWSYYALPTDLTFTVLAGQVVSPVSVAGTPGVAVESVAAADGTAEATADSAESDAGFIGAADGFEDAETEFEDDNFLLDPSDTSFAGAVPDYVTDSAASITDQIIAEQMVVG